MGLFELFKDILHTQCVDAIHYHIVNFKIMVFVNWIVAEIDISWSRMNNQRIESMLKLEQLLPNH